MIVEEKPLQAENIKSKSRKLLKKFVLGKERVVILNPGPNCTELLKEPNFHKSYIYEEFTPTKTSQMSFIKKGSFDIILLDSSGAKTLSKIQLNYLNHLKINKVRIYDINAFYEQITMRIPLINLSESWILNNDLFFVHTNRKFLALKRLFDILFSLALLPAALILMAPATILIWITSKGPALFRQTRVGRGGKNFVIYKLRTMSNNTYNRGFTIKNDTRVTPVGKILRLTKIDELPQLFNILKGDMSVIGPRPEITDIVENFSQENPYYVLRHMIRPGVTGWAQVNYPTATPLENLQKLEYDLFYIKNISPFLETKILWRTLKVVITLDSL